MQVYPDDMYNVSRNERHKKVSDRLIFLNIHGTAIAVSALLIPQRSSRFNFTYKILNVTIHNTLLQQCKIKGRFPWVIFNC